MKKIYKYRLEGILDIQIIRMPESAHILTVQIQNNKITLWATVNPDNLMTDRKFVVVGTGGEFNDDDASYIGTVQAMGLVWHIFEDISVE